MIVLAGLFAEVGSWAQVVAGVGMLIFIHELGHFLVAKWAGVRVLAFSLGFGPVLTGFHSGGTHYRLSLVPLGGYVKMAGETERPGGGYADDDYPSKPVGVRALIIAAGVIMNALLGFGLFAAALFLGVDLPRAAVGRTVPGSPAWEAGLLPGDRILRANGIELLSFQDLQMEAAAGEPLDLEVVRDGAPVRVTVEPRREEGDMAPRMGVVPPGGDRLVIAAGSPAAAAGLRTGDRVTAVGGLPGTLSDLFTDGVLQQVALPAAGPLRITVLRDGRPVTVALEPVGREPRIGIAPCRPRVAAVRPGGAAERAGWRPGDRPLAVGDRPVAGWMAFAREVAAAGGEAPGVRVAREDREVVIPIPAGAGQRLDLLRDLHFGPAPSPTRVEVLPFGAGPGGERAPTPAAAAGIPSGARITAVDGARVASYGDLVKRIHDAGERPFAVAWEADGPDGTPVPGEATLAAAPQPTYLGSGLWTGVEEEGGTVRVRVRSPGRLLSESWTRSVAVVRQIRTTIAGMIGGSLDRSAVGGPVLIAQIAHRTTREGFSQFLWLLAMLSINLMVLNILPIPLLDGGQLALLGLEAVTRRPPSEAVVGIAQMAGLVLLLGFILFVTYNDIARLVGG